MRVIHVMRKPLMASVAENILTHGCGALNIDATRLPSGGEHMVRGVVTRISVPSGDDRQGAALGQFRPGQSFVPTNHEGGRWPANLVVEHRPGCQHLGSQRVKGTSIHGESTAVRRSGAHAEAGGHQTIGRVQPVRGYSDADGMEVVAAWDCEPGCPVADLDGQGEAMGAHSAGVARTAKREAGKTGLFPMDGDGHRFGDAGGVSRFFKQVKG